MCPALTFHAQTELGLNIYVTVSDVLEGVTKTQTVVSEVQRDVATGHIIAADTHAIVSDIRRQILGSQGEADDQRQLVSDTRSIPATE